MDRTILLGVGNIIAAEPVLIHRRCTSGSGQVVEIGIGVGRGGPGLPIVIVLLGRGEATILILTGLRSGSGVGGARRVL